MNGTIVESTPEHLSDILDKYGTGDLDTYTQDGIARSITSLEKYRDLNSTNSDLHTLCGLVSSIISHFYVARGHATPNVPRHIDYYKSMNEIRRIIQQVKQIR